MFVLPMLSGGAAVAAQLTVEAAAAVFIHSIAVSPFDCFFSLIFDFLFHFSRRTHSYDQIFTHIFFNRSLSFVLALARSDISYTCNGVWRYALVVVVCDLTSHSSSSCIVVVVAFVRDLLTPQIAFGARNFDLI